MATSLSQSIHSTLWQLYFHVSTTRTTQCGVQCTHYTQSHTRVRGRPVCARYFIEPFHNWTELQSNRFCICVWCWFAFTFFFIFNIFFVVETALQNGTRMLRLLLVPKPLTKWMRNRVSKTIVMLIWIVKQRESNENQNGPQLLRATTDYNALSIWIFFDRMSLHFDYAPLATAHRWRARCVWQSSESGDICTVFGLGVSPNLSHNTRHTHAISYNSKIKSHFHNTIELTFFEHRFRRHRHCRRQFSKNNIRYTHPTTKEFVCVFSRRNYVAT